MTLEVATPHRLRQRALAQDNIIVVEGRGTTIENAGGHSKLGESVAKAVHTVVKEALVKQNGLVAHRDIFQRMKERNVDVFRIATRCMAL